MITCEEYATKGWKYDDGHDYHTVFTDGAEPTKAELLRKFGSIAKNLRLDYEWNITNEEEN